MTSIVTLPATIKKMGKQNSIPGTIVFCDTHFLCNLGSESYLSPICNRAMLCLLDRVGVRGRCLVLHALPLKLDRAAPWGTAIEHCVFMTVPGVRNSRNNQKPGPFLTLTFQILCKWICLSELTLHLEL